MTSDFISSYLTRANHFMRLKSRVLFYNNMALTILRDLCLDEEVHTLFYMWQSQIEIEYYSVAYFKCGDQLSLTCYSTELSLRIGCTWYVNA